MTVSMVLGLLTGGLAACGGNSPEPTQGAVATSQTAAPETAAAETAAPETAAPETADDQEFDPPTERAAEQPDDLCQQVVRGLGDCPGHFTGYQFDQATSQCVEIGAGGCNAHIPFRSMAACEQACEAPSSTP